MRPAVCFIPHILFSSLNFRRGGPGQPHFPLQHNAEHSVPYQFVPLLLGQMFGGQLLSLWRGWSKTEEIYPGSEEGDRVRFNSTGNRKEPIYRKYFPLDEQALYYLKISDLTRPRYEEGSIIERINWDEVIPAAETVRYFSEEYGIYCPFVSSGPFGRMVKKNREKHDQKATVREFRSFLLKRSRTECFAIRYSNPTFWRKNL